MRKVLILVTIFVFVAVMSMQAQVVGMTRKQFREYKEDYLRKEMKLSDDVAAKFFPLYEKFQDKKQKIYSENQALMDKANIASEAEYRTIIERLQELERASNDLEADFIQQLKTFLTYEQIFRLNKAESKFQKQLLKELTRKSKSSTSK